MSESSSSNIIESINYLSGIFPRETSRGEQNAK